MLSHFRMFISKVQAHITEEQEFSGYFMTKLRSEYEYYLPIHGVKSASEDGTVHGFIEEVNLEYKCNLL